MIFGNYIRNTFNEKLYEMIKSEFKEDDAKKIIEGMSDMKNRENTLVELKKLLTIYVKPDDYIYADDTKRKEIYEVIQNIDFNDIDNKIKDHCYDNNKRIEFLNTL